MESRRRGDKVRFPPYGHSGKQMCYLKIVFFARRSKAGGVEMDSQAGGEIQSFSRSCLKSSATAQA